MECIDGKDIFTWFYGKKNNIITLDGVRFEPAYIDKRIVIFRQYGTGCLTSQPDEEYFHLINSKDPIAYSDYKTDIEDYIWKVLEKIEENNDDLI